MYVCLVNVILYVCLWKGHVTFVLYLIYASRLYCLQFLTPEGLANVFIFFSPSGIHTPYAFHITTIVIVETQMWDKASRDWRLICEQLPTLLHQVVSRMGATGDRQRPRLSQSQGYKGRSGTSIMRYSELYSSCMQFSVMHHQRNRRYGAICTSERIIGYPGYWNRMIQSLVLNKDIIVYAYILELNSASKSLHWERQHLKLEKISLLKI